MLTKERQIQKSRKYRKRIDAFLMQRMNPRERQNFPRSRNPAIVIRNNVDKHVPTRYTGNTRNHVLWQTRRRRSIIAVFCDKHTERNNFNEYESTVRHSLNTYRISVANNAPRNCEIKN